MKGEMRMNNLYNTPVKYSMFTEAALSDSVLYNSFNTNGSLTKIMLSAIKGGIRIEKSHIENQINDINRTKLSPNVDAVMDNFYNGNIVLMMAPKDMRIPQVLPFFLMKTLGTVRAYIFLNNYGTLTVSEKNSNEKYLNMSMKDLYVLMEGAYIALENNANPMKVRKSLGLMRLSSKIYTHMILRILNKEYAVSIDPVLYTKVAFVVSYYYLTRIWESTNEDVNFTYAATVVETKEVVDKRELLLIKDEMEKADCSDIAKVIAFLSGSNPRLKALNFRYFTQCYINTFGAPALFGMETLHYFLFTITSVLIGSFVVNQPIISDVVKNIKGMNSFYPELVKAIS